MPRIKIDVTQADIDAAQRRNSMNCVISQAIARGIPGATLPLTDIQTIRFTLDGRRIVYLTPPVAQDYVVAFDAGDEITPFSFHLRYPVHITDMVRKSIRADGKGKTHTKPASSQKTVVTTAIPRGQHGGVEILTHIEGGEPPRVSMTHRSYGMRRLRINQQQ